MKEKPLRKTEVKEGFYSLVKGADGNHDGKVDRWELYHHCLKNYDQEWS